MAGTAPSQRQQAYADETLPGTINATPAFKLVHRAVAMKAAPAPEYGMSLVSKGALLGRTILNIPISGSLADGHMVYGAYDRWLESLLQGTWTADVLIDAKDQNAFSIEDRFPAGNGGTLQYERYKGVEAVSGSFKFASGQPMQFGMSFLGIGSDDIATTAKAGATYTNPAINDPYGSGADMTTLTMAGYTLDCFSSFELNISFEGRTVQDRILSNTACGIARGDIRATMKARMFVEANYAAMYNAARINHTPFKVTVNLGQTTLQKYRFEMTNTYFDANTPDWTGDSGFIDVMMTATYHPGTASVVKITRALV